MGIKDYTKFVKTKYGKACKAKWLNRYSHLYIDLNHALHHVCYKSKSPKEILVRIKSYLNDVVYDYRPTQKVYIGADGPAPIAKMILQRRRRYDKVKTLKEDEELNLSKNLSLNFTPGTEFMLNLADELAHFKAFLEIAYGVEVELDIDTDDEGEIKIRRVIERDQKKNPKLTAIVYSGDADMILLLMSLKKLANVYQILDKDTILSFKLLYNIHLQKFCQNGRIDTIKVDPTSGSELKRNRGSVKHDFIFVNLLFGNDYLPKVLYIQFENIWMAYSKLIKYYPLGLISYSRDLRRIEIDKEFMTRLILDTVEFNKLNYDPKFNIDELTSDDYKMYSDYMKGITWCFDMYSKGVCADYRYIYDHSPPHYIGILLQILSENTYSVSETQSIDSDLYGILLIPEKANSLLSEKQKELSKKLVKTHPIIYEEERCQKCSIFSKSMSDLNKQAYELRTETDTESDLLGLDISDGEDGEDEDTSNDESDDRRAELKAEILEKIRESSAKYAKHKKTHPNLTLGSIESIERSFSKLDYNINYYPGPY